MNETIFRPVETADLLAFLRNYLHTHDPEYAVVEKSCQEAIQSLKSALKPDSSPLLDAYIAAEDARISACLRILFWNGLHQNEACFRDPIQKKFLDLDFEDICQEAVLNSCVRRRGTTAGPLKSDTLAAKNRHPFRWSDSWENWRGDWRDVSLHAVLFIQ